MQIDTDIADPIYLSGKFNSRTIDEVLVLAQIVRDCNPITVRGAFYRAVSAGVFPDTSEQHYRKCGNLILKLRREGFIDYSMIVDSTRMRDKPSSWSGLDDFANTVARAYRKDLWSRQRDYVEVFVEKDAMSAVISPVTREYDIHLNVIRGSASETFCWNVAEEWRGIDKPIFAYYLGDHDPSGLLIEQDLRRRLQKFADKAVYWKRIAIDEDDFRDRSILGIPVKGNRTARVNRDYIRQFGDRCIEVDALAPDVIRERVRRFIEHHIDQDEWQRLQETERLELETVRAAMAPQIGGAS
jgi:hypothetical protein